MAAHIRQLCIVEPRTPHRTAVDLKAKRSHQVQRTAGVGTEPDDVAGVGWYLRLVQNDMKHGISPQQLSLRIRVGRGHRDYSDLAPGLAR